MPTYTDNNVPVGSAGTGAKDQGINEDNYWVFTSNLSLPTNSGTPIQNYTFNPSDHFETNGVALRDGDGDGWISAKYSDSAGTLNPDWHQNDGFVIRNEIYQVMRHWTYNITITYNDFKPGTTERVTYDSEIMVSKLVAVDGAGDFHQKAIFRFHDNVQSEIARGADAGDPAQGSYKLSDILSIKLGSKVGDVNNRIITNAFNDPPICFGKDTLISTENGLIPVQDLRVGDFVLTRDHGLQAIIWKGSRKITGRALQAAPHLRPIRIRAGSLGAQTPDRDLVVSPQHRILIRSAVAQEMFGADEILVAARMLLGVDGIEVAEDMDGVEYFHLLFSRHEVIFANGAQTESLYTGPQALKSVSLAAREEIIRLFPELNDVTTEFESARPFIKGKLARQLARNHAENHQPLVY